jgi:serine/threonine protein kinase
MPFRSSQLERGFVVGGYRIDELISRGGMGVVYRATNVALNRIYALKVLAPELADDDQFRERFRREMRVAASLHHPNVVGIHYAGEHDGLLFLVMDFVHGTDLRELLQKTGALTPDRAVDLLAQLASALDAAHRKGLVHRDVKPGNVLITVRDGEEHAYLTDFGLAKRSDTVGGLTKKGGVVGTVDYMSPEQVTGGLTDARTDIYALGCVFFQMLTGNVPYERENSIATLFAHVHEPPPVLEGKVADSYPDFGAVLDEAMAKEAADRYLSAGDFARAAAAALRGMRYTEAPTVVATGEARPLSATDPAALTRDESDTWFSAEREVARSAEREPERTAAPEVTRAPEPEPTLAPEVTRAAEPIIASEVARASEPTPEPEPEPTLAPEVTRAAEPEPEPERTLAPEVTRAAEPIIASEVIRAAEPTPEPEPTLAPEVTRAAEPIIASEVIRAAEPTPEPEPERTLAPEVTRSGETATESGPPTRTATPPPDVPAVVPPARSADPVAPAGPPTRIAASVTAAAGAERATSSAGGGTPPPDRGSQAGGERHAPGSWFERYRLLVLALAALVGAAVVVVVLSSGSSSHKSVASSSTTLAPGQHLTADATPVPTNRVTGKGSATVVLNGNVATVSLTTVGLLSGWPHLIHIHAGGQGICPPASAARLHNGHLAISTGNGIKFYGPPLVSLTLRGDTSARSNLAFPRFPSVGAITYKRTVTVSPAIAGLIREGNGVIVVHGIDYDGSGTYDEVLGPSDLASQFTGDSTAPALCGHLAPTQATASAADPHKQDAVLSASLTPDSLAGSDQAMVAWLLCHPGASLLGSTAAPGDGID